MKKVTLINDPLLLLQYSPGKKNETEDEKIGPLKHDLIS